MKAVLIKDEKLEWTDVPDPVCGDDDVIVKIAAAALNRADIMQREGKYPPPPGCPEWMGLEISGTIVKLGKNVSEKSSWKLGDEVCALLGGGGYAEYANVKYDMLMPVPKGFSLVEAAAMPEAFATAYLNLFIEGGLKAGDTVFMPAGGSGLASVLIPMAKAHGARVITTVRSDEKAEAIKNLGADRIVNTKKTDIAEVLKEEAESGHPVDIAVDCVGGSDVGRCMPYLAKRARWIMIAALAGENCEINLRTLYVKHIRLIGSTLRSRDPSVKADILAKLVRDIWPLAESGKLRPAIYKVLPITEAEKAQQILITSENVGKVVMTVG